MGDGFWPALSGLDFVMEEAASWHGVSHAVMRILDPRRRHAAVYRPASYHTFRALSMRRAISRLETFHRLPRLSKRVEPKGEENPEKSELATAAFIPIKNTNYRVNTRSAKSSGPRAWCALSRAFHRGLVVESLWTEVAAAGRRRPAGSSPAHIGEDRKIPDFTNPEGRQG